MKIWFLFFIVLPVYSSTYSEVLIELADSDVELVSRKNYLEYYSATKLAGFGRFLPKFTLTSSQNKNKIEEQTETETKTNSMSLSMNVFSFGEDLFHLRSTSNMYESEVQAVEFQRLSTYQSISELLFEYIKVKNAIEIRNEIIDLKDKSYQIAKKRFQLGKLAKHDYQKVGIDLNNTQAQLENDRISLRTIEASLANYGNVHDLELKWPWENQVDKMEKVLENNLQIENHPSFQHANLDYDAKDYSQKSVVASFLGDISISLTQSRISDLDSNDEIDDKRFMISYSIPLFNNFIDYANYKKAVADKYNQQTKLLNTKRYLEKSFNNQKEILKSSIRTYRLRVQTLKLSQDLYQHTLKQFRNGRLSVNELILDQDRLLQTKILANAGSASLHQSMVQYCTSLGKDILRNCF